MNAEPVKYMLIKLGQYYKRPARMITIENEFGEKFFAFPGTPEWNCLNRMLRNNPVSMIPQKNGSYDFAWILWTYLQQNSEE